MIQFLFIISYYKTSIFNYETYFTKLSKLEYGFNENANFTFRFSFVSDQMIFGLATHDEIKQIKSLQYDQQYCQGGYQLSQIQFLISSDKQIQGTVSSKSVLIPYSFACSSSYSFTLELSYQNGRNHLDYRCQNLLIFTFIFCIITFIYIIFYISSSFCGSNLMGRSPFNILLILLFVIFLVQDSITFLFFKLKDFQEYFLGEDDDRIVTFIMQVVSLSGIFFSFVFIFCFCFMKYLKDNKKQPSCCVFTLFIIPIVLLTSIFPMMLFVHVNWMNIVVSILFLLFAFFVIFLPPACSLEKFSLLVYLLGVFFSCPVLITFLSLYYNDVCVHYTIFVAIIFFCVSQALSMLLLLINLFLNRTTNGDNLPIFQPQTSYTLQSFASSQSTSQNQYTSINSIQDLNYSNNNNNSQDNFNHINVY